MKSAVTALLVLFLTAALPPGAGAAEEPYELTVGAFAAPGSPWAKSWQRFKENVEARSDGRIKVKLLTGGEAGGEHTAMTYVRRNRLQVGGFTLAGTASVVPELDMLLSPFFYDSREQVDFIMDEYLFDTFQSLFAAKGLELLRWVEVGWLNVFGKQPVMRPEDIADKRMRIQASRAAEIFAESLDAETVQMSFGDLIPSLQTGLVFGGETNIILYSVTGLGNEAPHLTMTRHAYDTGTVVANREWMQSLPKDLAEIVRDAFPSSQKARAAVRRVSRALLAQVEDMGARKYELTEAQRQRWREATAENAHILIETIGGDAQTVYDRMLEGRARWRAMHGDGS